MANNDNISHPTTQCSRAKYSGAVSHKRKSRWGQNEDQHIAPSHQQWQSESGSVSDAEAELGAYAGDINISHLTTANSRATLTVAHNMLNGAHMETKR